ncbi:hypothetical protein ScPMuIL_016605 [Solemya velum]
MSVSVFIDITFSEQTLELRSYLKSLGAEISEENSEGGLLMDLQNIIEASDICWKEIKDETECEMVFNGIISLILLLPIEEVEEPTILFCQKVSKGDKLPAVRLKVLSNLFNALDEKLPFRLDVYCSMVRLAGQSETLHYVNTDLAQIKQWIKMWDIKIVKVQNLLRTLHQAMIETKMSESATKVMIELLGTYTEDNASQARDDAHRCIVTCLGDPNTYLLDHLLTLKPVKFLEGELIHDLLTIFVTGKLRQYQQFYKNNTDFISSLGLSHEQNLRKMRFLTLIQMAETKKEIDFATLQEEMQIGPENVEDFIIEVLHTKALKAKIDQQQKKVMVKASFQRTFGRQHWQQLRSILENWQPNLARIRNSLRSLELVQSAQ